MDSFRYGSIVGDFQVTYGIVDGEFNVVSVYPYSEDTGNLLDNYDLFDLILNYCPDLGVKLWDASLEDFNLKAKY